MWLELELINGKIECPKSVIFTAEKHIPEYGWYDSLDVEAKY